MAFTTTSLRGAGSINIAADVSEDEAITLTDSFVVKGTFDTRNYARIIFFIQNSGDTNDLDYDIYGHGDPNGGTAPTFATATWFQLKGTTTVGEDSVGVETLTDRYAYIVLRMKRTTAAADTTGKVWIRCHKA